MTVTPGSKAAVTESAGAASTSRPAPITPPPLQPMIVAPGKKAEKVAGTRA